MFSFLVVFRYFFYSFPSEKFAAKTEKKKRKIRKAFDFSCLIYFDENNNCEERRVTGRRGSVGGRSKLEKTQTIAFH